MRKVEKVIGGIVFLLLLVFTLKPIVEGSIPFWYDPARDLLLGLDNLHKPSFIGPPSGIPGIFYGPYWIWLLSAAEVISRDPRIITFLVLTLPYFTIFPFILYKFSQLFGKYTWLLLFALFILHFPYPTQLWNPHPAPLLYLLLVYLLVFTPFVFKRENIIKLFLAGFVGGLIVNFHISFGIGILLSSTFFVIIQLALVARKNHKNWFLFLLLFLFFCFGVIISFAPFFLFEIKHGFHQIQALLVTLRKSTFENSSVVGQVGMSKNQISASFWARLEQFIAIPMNFIAPLLILSLFYIVYRSRKFKEKLTQLDRKFLTLILLNIAIVTYIYLTSKNPVWGYHFISVELFFLLIIGWVVGKVPVLQKLLMVWVGILLIMSSINFVQTFNSKTTNSTFAAKKQIIDAIYADAHGPFSIAVNEPSIYTYDYDYLFGWLGKKYHFTPDIENKQNIVYLIITDPQPGTVKDFTNVKAPDKEYTTVSQWQGQDKTLIIKRYKK